MMKVIAGLALVAIFMVIGATSALAHPGHTGCKAYGHHNAAEAQAGTLPDELHEFGPGVIDDVIRLVHVGGQFGDVTVPAFCETA